MRQTIVRAARRRHPFAAFGWLLLVGGLIALTGCSVFDPWQRAGTWRPTSAAQINLAAEAADPDDLARGRSFSGSSGQLDAAAVDRLNHDKVKELPQSTISQIGASSSGGGSSSSSTDQSN